MTTKTKTAPTSQDFDREFRAWLKTSAGRFAEYLAARPAPAR